MTDQYIGARSSSEIAKILGRSPHYLNEGMSQLVRSACLRLGIKKTEQRRRLNFYIVTGEEYERLTDDKHKLINNIKGQTNVHHLVRMDKSKFSEVVDEINAKYGGRRMDHKAYAHYQQKMTEALSKIIEVTGADHNIKKEAQKIGANPYKVGDIIQLDVYDLPHEVAKAQGYPAWANLRVRWAGKRQIEVERLAPRFAEGGWWPNTESILTHFTGVIPWGLNDKGKIPWSGAPHGHFVPFKGNEHLLQWYPVGGRDWETKQITYKRYQWTKYGRWVPEHEHNRYNGKGHYESRACATAELGYYYNDRGSYD